jgi:hypothetical protein
MACRRITHSGSPCRGRAAGTTGTSTAGNRTWAASAGKSHTVCWYLRSSSGAASKSSARDRGCRPPRREGPRNRPHRNGGVPTPLSERGPKASSQVAPQLAAVDARDRERPSTVSVRRPSSGAASKSSSRDRGGADPVGRGLEIVRTRSGVPTPSGGASKSSSPNRGCRRGGLYHTPRSGCPERMRLPLDILEGQNFARKNHHGVGPRRAGAAELAAVRRRPDRPTKILSAHVRLKGCGTF